MEFEKLVERIDITRVRIEALLDGASMIHVASARREDGAHALATGLAYSFAATGQTTILIETPSDAASKSARNTLLASDVFAKIRPGKDGEPARLRLSDVGARSVADLKELFAKLRGRFAIAITSNSLAENGGAVGLAALSDVVLISVKKNRTNRGADRELSDALKGMNAPIMGVIMVDHDIDATVGSLRGNETRATGDEVGAVRLERAGARAS